MSAALAADRPAPAACVAEFAEKGHTCVRGLASADEVERYRPAIEAATEAWNRETRDLEERDTYSKAFLQTTNLWRHDVRVREFVFAPRFARVAAELLGVDGVRLYHDQSLFKEPGGGHTPWHRDQFYWPLDTDRTITMWMPLADIDPAVGSMTFVSGSHRMDDIDRLHISDDSEARFAEIIEERGLPTETHGVLCAGDATFHAGWTLHSAGPNPTDAARPAMTVIWYAADARVIDPEHVFHEFDAATWLPGCAPGDPAASDLNPRLWPA